MAGNFSRSRRLPAWAKWLGRVIVRGFLFRGSQLLAWVSGIIMVILAGVTFLDVIFHNTPLPSIWRGGSYEFSELLMAILAASGLAYCWYAKGHVRIGLVLEHLRPRVRAIFGIFSSLCALAFITAIGWSLLNVGMATFNRGDSTEVLHLPIGIFMIAFSLMMLHFALVLAASAVEAGLKSVRRESGAVPPA